MSLKKVFILLIILLLGFSLPCTNVSYASPDTLPRIGVWITVFSPEEVLNSKENIDRLIDTCKNSAINDIYIQIYRADKAYYDSDIADKTPYEQIFSASGEDTLKYLINKAGENNIKIHAWINLLSIAQNKNAVILKKYGKDILTLDQYGRFSMPENGKDKLDKYYIREKQFFLEPGDIRVRKYLTDITEEIIKKYPYLSGLHLDYIRYPVVVPFIPGSRFTSHGISYGYGKINTENFKNATGLNIKTMEKSRENFRLWDEWRRKQITALLAEISERTRKLNPSLEISCTIVPSAERTYLTSLQDWTEWLRQGYADYVVAMNYTDDLKLMELNTNSLLVGDFSDSVHIGIGAYILKDTPEELEAQLKYLKKVSPRGIVLFSYDEISANQNLQKFLKDNFS